MTHTLGPMTTKPGCRCTDLISANGKEIGYVKDASHAAFIVRACNSHEAMLEALKLCVEALEFIPCRARNEAQEAIRLAEGRS